MIGSSDGEQYENALDLRLGKPVEMADTFNERYPKPTTPLPKPRQPQPGDPGPADTPAVPDTGRSGQQIWTENQPPGVARLAAAQTGVPEIDQVLNSPTTSDVIMNPKVNRDHTIPYTAGGSVPLEDPTMFVDKRFPKSFTVDGKTFDPADPFIVHENIEQHVMEELVKGGMPQQTAYKVAHFEFAEKAEGAWYKNNGINKHAAEAAYRPFLEKIQKEPADDIPPNLYKDPYPHDDPHAAEHEAYKEAGPKPEDVLKAHKILADAASKASDKKPWKGSDLTPQAGPEYDKVEKDFPDTKLKSGQFSWDEKDDVSQGIVKGAAPVSGFTEPYPKTAEDIEKLLDENGSIRIHDQSPAVKEWLKTADPDKYERFDLNEFEGRYDKDFSGETMIIRKRSAYTS